MEPTRGAPRVSVALSRTRSGRSTHGDASISGSAPHQPGCDRSLLHNDGSGLDAIPLQDGFGVVERKSGEFELRQDFGIRRTGPQQHHLKDVVLCCWCEVPPFAVGAIGLSHAFVDAQLALGVAVTREVLTPFLEGRRVNVAERLLESSDANFLLLRELRNDWTRNEANRIDPLGLRRSISALASGCEHEQQSNADDSPKHRPSFVEPQCPDKVHSNDARGKASDWSSSPSSLPRIHCQDRSNTTPSSSEARTSCTESPFAPLNSRPATSSPRK